MLSDETYICANVPITFGNGPAELNITSFPDFMSTPHSEPRHESERIGLVH